MRRPKRKHCCGVSLVWWGRGLFDGDGEPERCGAPVSCGIFSSLISDPVPAEAELRLPAGPDSAAIYKGKRDLLYIYININ